MKGVKGSLKRRTMIKPSIGAVRASSYDLPPDTFIFGIQNTTDDAGCAAVLQHWSASAPSMHSHREAEVDFLKANVSAIAKGHITAAAQRVHVKEMLASNGAAMVLKKKPGTASLAPASLADRTQVFGMKSVLDGEGVRELIEAKFTDFRGDDKLYPDVSHRTTRRCLPPPKATAASRGHDINSYSKPVLKERLIPRRLRHVQSVLKRAT